MSDSGSHQISRLLARWNDGDRSAFDQLVPLVYDEMRRVAQGVLRRDPNLRSIQPSDLLHETFIKLAGNDHPALNDRNHFMAVAATAMRHILVDHARSKASAKRGGNFEIRSLKDDVTDIAAASQQILGLDAAMNRLAQLDERKCRIVELKFYAGLTNEETAESLGISPETVKRDWRFARAWLLNEMAGDR